MMTHNVSPNSHECQVRPIFQPVAPQPMSRGGKIALAIALTVLFLLLFLVGWVITH
jgi:hypothetical protein